MVYVPLFDYPRGYGRYCDRKFYCICIDVVRVCLIWQIILRMELNVEEFVKDNRDFGAECIQCGACVDNCPKKALSYGLKRSKQKDGKYKEDGLCFIRSVES